MPLETANYINQLVPANPPATDLAGDAYEHLNLIKKVLVQSFPNCTGPVNCTAADLNLLTGLAGVGALLQIPSGTFMIFGGPTAPVSWTQVTTLNDIVFRLVNTAGGTLGGSWSITGVTATMQPHTLTVAEIPPHTHTYSYTMGNILVAQPSIQEMAVDSSVVNTGATGGGGSHTSVLTVAADATWRPAYVDTIVCARN